MYECDRQYFICMYALLFTAHVQYVLQFCSCQAEFHDQVQLKFANHTRTKSYLSSSINVMCFDI